MNKGLRDKILELRAKEKTYDEICEILKCSKSNVSYHCSPLGKTGARRRRVRVVRIQSSRLKAMHGSKCCVCGYSRCEKALEFHHLDSSVKTRTVSQALSSFGYAKALEESKKCVLICANCHRELHYGIIVL